MVPTLALFSDVGGGELIVIGIIALLLFGKNLPTVSRSVGKALAEFKRGISQATTEIKTEMDAAAEEVQTAKAEVASSIKVDLADVTRDSPPASSAAPEPKQKPAEEKETSQSLDRPDTATRPLVRPAPGTVASNAISPAAALDKLEVKAPAKIPPPVE
ncbi:MAG TPA: twin-arginine translocase TatA/TatE family subunit [Planctomycetota bacterium]|nr:twin-arginine translocase TatA/TatE family subunit [Planctomycetota bacterium]